jgi:hypothetical protein
MPWRSPSWATEALFPGWIRGLSRNGCVGATRAQLLLLAIIYGIGISLLSLATPVSVQMLINTVANMGLTTPLVVLSLSLFFLLLLAGGLNALRIYILDVFGRRFYARMVSEISLRTIYARNPFFDDEGKSALFNRYFDIIIVMKMVPNLLVGGFTIVLQTVVGFILVSSYHPLLLAFNATILAADLAGLDDLGPARHPQRRGAVAPQALQRRLARVPGPCQRFLQDGVCTSPRRCERRTKSPAPTWSSIASTSAITFSQTLSFPVHLRGGERALLGLGGWLVIGGELSLGQLVAAELVLSVVFLGVSQMGIYLSYFYDVCGAVDELSLFFKVEQDRPKDAHTRIEGDSSLTFNSVVVGPTITLDFKIPPARASASTPTAIVRSACSPTWCAATSSRTAAISPSAAWTCASSRPTRCARRSSSWTGPTRWRPASASTCACRRRTARRLT